MTKSGNKLLWVVPESSGGISSYTNFLWPAVREQWEASGNTAAGEPYVGMSIDHIREESPKIVHVQHEFGILGRKVPPFYAFPRWVRKLRKTLPETWLVASAHTVIDQTVRYPVKGYGLQTPLRWSANQFVLPYLHKLWTSDTWGNLDGVIVHSLLQTQMIRKACKRVETIPCVVPPLPSFNPLGKDSVFSSIPEGSIILLVGGFGFISRSKGHDIAVRALAHMKHEAVLVFAGSPRNRRDAVFVDECLQLARTLGIRERVFVTGYVPDNEICAAFQRVNLVVAPFRESSGSLSLSLAMASRLPILASDIPLNKEIAEREPGCLAMFESENAKDCGEMADYLLDEPTARENLVVAAKRYAESCSPIRIAERHVEFYSRFM